MIKRYYNAVKGGVLAHFLPETPIGDVPEVTTQRANLFGLPTATLTIKIVDYANTNVYGWLKVNDVVMVLNDSFTVTLDADGNGQFTAQIRMTIDDPGSYVMGKFEIISSTFGYITSGADKQWQIEKSIGM